MIEKMMPGQQPHEERQRRRIEQMIADACGAEENFDVDDLEARAVDFFDRADREYMEFKDGDRKGDI